MTHSESNLTPMMRQYHELKEQHKDEVLFFRLGDFYEMFLDDAIEISQLLNLTLTSRHGVPMCGIPYHAAKNYIKRLLEAGKKIAVCEQTELPDSTRSLATREVVQIITAGTVVEDEFLDSHTNSYIIAFTMVDKEISCAYCELSSGQFFVRKLSHQVQSCRALIEELSPKEILIDEEWYFSSDEIQEVFSYLHVQKTRLPSWYFDKKQSYTLLVEHIGTSSLKGFGLEQRDTEIPAAGALLRYLRETSRSTIGQIFTYTKIDDNRYLHIDESTRKNLELIRNIEDGSQERTLFSAIQNTCTAAGSRLLKSWISSPLASLQDILYRQQEVTFFLQQKEERKRVRAILKETKDLARLSSRVAMHRAYPQDLLSIGQSIASFFTLISEHWDHYRHLLGDDFTDQTFQNLLSLMDLLTSSLSEDCQGPFQAGSVIRAGYHEKLDQLRSLRSSSSTQLQEYVTRLKAETGIPTIKLSHNRIIGHYVEIPKIHNHKIPQTFFRKQTLVNAERYTTEELTAYERELLGCEEEAERLERELFEQLVQETSQYTQLLQQIGMFLSFLDCIQGLATCAEKWGYCCPTLTEDEHLSIVQGRHPVVEQYLSVGSFVENSLSMGEAEERFALITGPNMAGKSTYLRQNALIILLAHIGSYVPAQEAVIGIVDHIFCRVGSSDNLARGESTFLIEMQEAAYILNMASSRSFVIMDEIGRGTSTQDGMSIAYAIMKHLISQRVKTLFATHYHELTMLDTSSMRLLTLAVSEQGKEVLFLKKVIQGSATNSYGIHVAKMAGIPRTVIKDAQQFQRKHFEDYNLSHRDGQMHLFTECSSQPSVEEDPLIEEIFDTIALFELEHSTPMDAMRCMEKLKKLLSSR